MSDAGLRHPSRQIGYRGRWPGACRGGTVRVTGTPPVGTREGLRTGADRTTEEQPNTPPPTPEWPYWTTRQYGHFSFGGRAARLRSSGMRAAGEVGQSRLVDASSASMSGPTWG